MFSREAPTPTPALALALASDGPSVGQALGSAEGTGALSLGFRSLRCDMNNAAG